MKVCPVQPCGTRIGDNHAACGFHWSLVDDQAKREFRTAVRARDRRRAALWVVRALASVWTFFDELATNMPPEHSGRVRCICPACASALERARRALGFEDEFWARLQERSAA